MKGLVIFTTFGYKMKAFHGHGRNGSFDTALILSQRAACA
jgi:hypothetical protein